MKVVNILEPHCAYKCRCDLQRPSLEEEYITCKSDKPCFFQVFTKSD